MKWTAVHLHWCLYGWIAINLSVEACNISVEGIHVATCYKSSLLCALEMFAHFEIFQKIVNNTIFCPRSIFTPKGKEKTKR